TARLEVVARHAVSALYNSAEWKRIPGRWIWRPLAAVQEGLGGKAKFWLTFIGTLLGLLLAAMIFVPYPLKMDANGQLLPKQRNWVFPIAEDGVHVIKKFPEQIKTGSRVHKDQEVVIMYSASLAQEIEKIQGERAKHDLTRRDILRQLS